MWVENEIQCTCHCISSHCAIYYSFATGYSHKSAQTSGERTRPSPPSRGSSHHHSQLLRLGVSSRLVRKRWMRGMRLALGGSTKQALFTILPLWTVHYE